MSVLKKYLRSLHEFHLIIIHFEMYLKRKKLYWESVMRRRTHLFLSSISFYMSLLTHICLTLILFFAIWHILSLKCVIYLFYLSSEHRRWRVLATNSNNNKLHHTREELSPYFLPSHLLFTWCQLDHKYNHMFWFCSIEIREETSIHSFSLISYLSFFLGQFLPSGKGVSNYPKRLIDKIDAWSGVESQLW